MPKPAEVECIGDVCFLKTEVQEGATEGERDGTSSKTKKNSQGEAESVEKADKEEEKKQPKGEKSRKKKPKSSPSSFKQIHSQTELDGLISVNDAVIIEFKTSWCGACKTIERLFEELSINNAEEVMTGQVMCDKNKETKKLAAAHGITSYPVFIVFEQGGVSTKWNGADSGKLEKAFERLSGGRRVGGGKGGRKKKR